MQYTWNDFTSCIQDIFFEKIMNDLSYKRGIIICCRFPWLHKTGNSNYVYKIHINFHSQQERYYINLRILYKHQLLILSLNLKILKYLNKRKLKCKCTQKKIYKQTNKNKHVRFEQKSYHSFKTLKIA